jgi:NAD(P)-dependent dehydrogenase (short-subunit alcohol dehydrogenase family)
MDVSRASLKLKGRTCVVTGAGSGIGRALALKAAAEGMKLALCDVNTLGLAETVRLAFDAGAAITWNVVDVRDAAALEAFAATANGDVALVFANAGVLRTGRVADQSGADLKLMLEINVLGAVNTIQAFLPGMRRQSAPTRIVVTGSEASFAPFPNLGGYCATKHALLALTEALSMELAAEGSSVGVSLLTPGSVDTAIFGDQGAPNPARAITPDQVAEIAFAGVAEGRGIIATHADLAERLDARLVAVKAALGA